MRPHAIMVSENPLIVRGSKANDIVGGFLSGFYIPWHLAIVSDT